MTSPTNPRRRRLAAAILALPLCLAMAGTAFAAPTAVGSDLRVAPAGQAEPAVRAQAQPAVQAQAKAAPTAAPTVGRTSQATATSSTPDSSSNPDKHGTATSAPLTSPQPLSKADVNGTGANPGTTCTHSYCSTRDGSASGNGVGDGAATGKACAGCVGKADNKNPAGQAPDGTDPNAGYECDRNQGIGKTNPAHTGCTTTTTPTTAPAPSAPSSGTASGTVDVCPNMAGNQPVGTSCVPRPTTGTANGTASITVAVACRTVAVSSSKDISNVVVVFADGTSVKFDGLSGRTWTRTFSQDVARATAKSATTSVTGTSRGCGATAPGSSAPPAATCPNGAAMPQSGDVRDCAPVRTGKGAGPGQITICHATGNPSSPFVATTVSPRELSRHRTHSSDLIPMPAGGCPRALSGGTAGGGTQPPVCPTNPAMGPVMAGCTPPGAGGPGGGTQGPVCPTNAAMGPVMAGCTPPGAGGNAGGPAGNGTPGQPGNNPQAPAAGTASGGVTPGQPANNPQAPAGGTPISGVTPGQPATTPQAPAGAVPNGGIAAGQPGIVPGLPVAGGLPIGGVAPGQAGSFPGVAGRPVFAPNGGVASGVLSGTAAGAATGPAGGAAAGATTRSARTLPFTGVALALLVELAALLLLAGGGLLVTTRRKRTVIAG